MTANGKFIVVPTASGYAVRHLSHLGESNTIAFYGYGDYPTNEAARNLIAELNAALERRLLA
ncbi:hypothetical protein HOU02_gp225 [Caulobacter phage CcrBL9]|uniref:Uncharacterized protein n=1 Tax=Caulobacter phage CcrBL9 TaxID=2283270 RepID=A0A385ECW9_9CAUD|nr:hypothetical protein HOU02_gp225 [Caulobacter phage CcrBL9]AXQ69500.1 hypothetical protein CcrBL9_gp476 [Caulobacter phage CcrBL9]